MSALKCLNTDELCQTLGISRSTLHRLIKSNNFPAPLIINKGAKRYLESDVLQWLDSQRDAVSNAAAAKEG